MNTSIPERNNVVIAGCLSTMDDERLVSAARAGDRSAFTELYERHSRKVLPKIYRITKNWEDAEDAFHDAVLRAFVHLKSFEGRSNFTSWLTRIAINCALMVLRKRRGGGEVSFEHICNDSEKNSRAWEPPDLAETPETRCARQESEELLRNAVQRLPCIFRDALELQYFREYSSCQVAEELGISASAAKSRLMRARKTVRRRLSGTQPRLKPLSTRSTSLLGVNSKTASVSVPAGPSAAGGNERRGRTCERATFRSSQPATQLKHLAREQGEGRPMRSTWNDASHVTSR